MTPDDLWQRYLDSTQCHPMHVSRQRPSAWAFSPKPDALLELVLAGRKTATASPAELYEYEGEPLPAVGDLSILLDGAEQARCLIETTAVSVEPFHGVSAEHAAAEGEGDGSLAYWRRVHEAAFTPWLAEAGMSLTPTTAVVCERFRVIWAPSEGTD